MKKVNLLCLFAALMAFGIFSCSDDEPKPNDKNPDPDIDEVDDNKDDGEETTGVLLFGNAEATVVKQAFPASSGAGAPVLLAGEENKDISGISGGRLSLNFDESTGANIKGVYVQINGTDHYYDVVLNTSSPSGRALATGQRAFRKLTTSRLQESGSLLLTLPADLEEGNFCLTYAVYNDQGLISNSIEVCVSVMSRGGENSNFLTATTWSMEVEYWSQIYEGVTEKDTTVIGKLYEDTYSYTCLDQQGEPIGEISLYENYILDYFDVTLSTDGTFSIEERETEEVAADGVTCETEQVTYVEEVTVYKTTGTWSYNDTKKELILNTEHVEYSETTNDGAPELAEEQVTPELEIYQVKQENGKLVLSGDIDDGQSLMIFAPKN